MLRRLKHLIQKEFIQVWRDTKLRFFIIFPPIVQLIMYGYAIHFDIKHIHTAIYDEDHSPESRHLASRFWATDFFRINGGYLDNQDQLRRLIDQSLTSGMGAAADLHSPDDDDIIMGHADWNC